MQIVSFNMKIVSFGDSLHERKKPIIWEKNLIKKTYQLSASAEFAQSVLSVKMSFTAVEETVVTVCFVWLFSLFFFLAFW